MEFSLKQIAQLVEGEIEGDQNLKITNIGKIEEAQLGDIAFLSNLKYEHFIYQTNATAVIVNRDFTPKHQINVALIKVENAYSAFTTILKEYDNLLKFNKKGIADSAFVHETAILSDDNYIGAQAYIGEKSVIGKNTIIHPQVFIGSNVTIGKNCIFYPGARILDDTQIGDFCTFHPNSVVGSDGFGFAPLANGTYETIPQVGNVIISNNVSIGANTTVDRATMGSTIIGNGTKIDNLCQIAHNVQIGENTVMAAQSGIAGSAKLGSGCKIGGHVAILGHITVPNNTIILGKSGVTKTFNEEGLMISGFPATKNKEALRSQVQVRRLPEMESRIKELDQKILDLQKEILQFKN
jgi:UDP-3-O-[3-hydroxymyristoyl] glucosamine N-acyltransferase